MKRVAALMTCHNRMEKTINCLVSLDKAVKATPSILVDIYLTDDGSTDGTSCVVQERFPNVTLLKGNGMLFWAGGMRNSWKAALKKEYDTYLLLNDDTEISLDLFQEMKRTHLQTIAQYGKEGIYIGSTREKSGSKITYGGSIITNSFFYSTNKLIPNGTIQLCDLGNANIMFVTNEVVKKIGILSEGYVHGAADYDFTLKAGRKKIPVVVMGKFCGECDYDHAEVYENFCDKSLRERIRYLYNPLGLAFDDKVRYMKINFPYRLPFVLGLAWFKVFFPRIFLSLNKLR